MKRFTLVTSFDTEETDPARVQGDGGKPLCAYLRYVDSSGGDLGALRDGGTTLNPFELDVMERLQAVGGRSASRFPRPDGARDRGQRREL